MIQIYYENGLFYCGLDESAGAVEVVGNVYIFASG